MLAAACRAISNHKTTGRLLTATKKTMQQGVPYDATPSAARDASTNARDAAGGINKTGPSPSPPVDIGDRIKADHARLFSYYDQLQGAPPDEAERLRHRIVHDLAVHSLSEEEVLYPALKKAFGSELR